MRIDTGYLAATLAGLVQTNSINPFFEGGTNERAIAETVGEELRRLGFTVAFHEPEPDRVSVVGTLPGRGGPGGQGGGRSLMLYAHLDTVGVQGMKEPFSGAIRNGRMYGRGTYDMKGGLAACLAAAKALAESNVPLAGDLLVAGVADEEVASLGMSEVLRHHRPDGAVVTEATELDVCLAHKGFSWIEVETVGRAAHGSRFDEGVDANMKMGRFLAQLDRLEQSLRNSQPHPLVGPPSLHAGTLHGGSAPSVYAARCRLEVERRTLPGESEAAAVAELQRIVDRLTASDPDFRARVRATLSREPFEVRADAPIVRAVMRAAAAALNRTPRTIGQSFWMDAALLAAAGVETVVIGPSGAGAHADEEWVDLDSVARLAEILARTAVDFCGTA